jgi:tetratricopeptide (TPR) repeat protein
MRCSTRSLARARRGFLAALLGCLLFGASAAQAGSAEVAQAERVFRKAQRAYQQGRYLDAVHGYRQAFALAPFPELLFNLWQAYRQLGRHAEAREHYLRYLQVSPVRPANAEVVEELIAEMSRAVGGPFTAGADASDRPLGQRPPGGEPTGSAESRPTSAPPGSFAPPMQAPTLLPQPGLPDAAAPSAALAEGATSSPAPSLLGRWWFWTGVGAVVAAGAGTAYALQAPRGDRPSLGEVRF